MTCAKLLVFLYVLRVSTSDWVSEWMAPIQDQFEVIPDKARRSNNGNGILKHYEDEYQKMVPIIDPTEYPSLDLQKPDAKGHLVSGLKLKLETTLENAKMLAETLKNQITELSSKENVLKEIITHGRNGVTIVTVSTMGHLPRKYIIREGVWTLCTGVMQPPTPVARNNAYDSYTAPRCFGQEVQTTSDPCVFNSLTKYETIPTRRRLQYVEDDYLCLKSSFNGTLEQYLSVPKRLINETCTTGVVRSLEDNLIECGLRVLSEYSYYPDREYISPELPLEYCIEEDGSCKLIVAWHISNSTIENFEFLKNEPNFKKYFIKSSSAIEQIS